MVIEGRKRRGGRETELSQGSLAYGVLNRQKQNGIKSFELKPNCLVEGMNQADSIAKKILSNYKNGKSYIESDWQGTPKMRLGAMFESRSKKDTNNQTYECLSNEFTIDGGLKTKTKARQK